MAPYDLTIIGVRVNVRWDLFRAWPHVRPAITATKIDRVVGTKVPVYVTVLWHGHTVKGVLFVYRDAVAMAKEANNLSLLEITMGDFDRIIQGAEESDDDPLEIRSLKLDDRLYDLYPPPTFA